MLGVRNKNARLFDENRTYHEGHNQDPLLPILHVGVSGHVEFSF